MKLLADRTEPGLSMKSELPELVNLGLNLPIEESQVFDRGFRILPVGCGPNIGRVYGKLRPGGRDEDPMTSPDAW